MARLEILAAGNSTQAQAQTRGKLFEKLMTDVLRQLGFDIDRIASVNYSGMEIDIEGRAIVTGIRMYAECKCYDTGSIHPSCRPFSENTPLNGFETISAKACSSRFQG